MNIKTTGYDETGTLFNFDIIVKSNEDFEKVINVLRTFYEIKSQGFMSTKNERKLGEVTCVQCGRFYNLAEGQRCLDMNWRCKQCIMENLEIANDSIKDGEESTNSVPEKQVKNEVNSQEKSPKDTLNYPDTHSQIKDPYEHNKFIGKDESKDKLNETESK